jgi:hypothetical protein
MNAITSHFALLYSTRRLNAAIPAKMPWLIFLVGSFTCLIRFQFENEYFWFCEKVAITLPTQETLYAGR